MPPASRPILYGKRLPLAFPGIVTYDHRPHGPGFPLRERRDRFIQRRARQRLLANAAAKEQDASARFEDPQCSWFASGRRLLFWIELCAVLFLATVAIVCIFCLHRLVLVRTTVYDVADTDAFAGRDLPGFVHQSTDSPKLHEFQRHIAPLVDRSMDSLTKVVAIRKWVREQEKDAQYYDARGALVDDTEEPERLLDEQKRGVRSACRRFSYILVGALLSIGEDARIIAVTGDIHRSALEHELVEVWIKELGKWVLRGSNHRRASFSRQTSGVGAGSIRSRKLRTRRPHFIRAEWIKTPAASGRPLCQVFQASLRSPNERRF